MARVVAAGRANIPRRPQTWLIAVGLALLFVLLLSLLPRITDRGALIINLPWVPALDLSLTLYLDGLSLIFSLITVGIGAVIALYAGAYFDARAALNRFYLLFLPFTAAMLLLLISGNLITLFIAWELTSVFSFLLISFHSDRPAARRGALQALMVTGSGGLALLVGLVLLGTTAGSMELGQVLSSSTLRDSPAYTAIAVLIFLGCFTKSAQWPFHFWLPGAMSAPTPASAYLHSATMVKAGIYLLLRLSPVLGDTALWQTTLMSIGLITLLLGAVLALKQHDLKSVLAYSTISQLGVFVALIGLPGGEGIKAALVGIIAHSLYKAALFMVVGAVEHSTGTRNLNALGRLARTMPGWAIVTVLAALSMAGLPPLLGFVAKEVLLEAAAETLPGGPLLLIGVLVGAAFTAAVAFSLIWDVFWGREPTPASAHDAHGAHGAHHHEPHSVTAMLAGPALLAGFGLVAALQLKTFILPLIRPVLGGDPYLSLFSGFNLPFALSLVAITGGAVLFALRRHWRAWSIPGVSLPTGSDVYRGIIRAVERAGTLMLRSQGGNLRYYLAVILCSMAALQATAGLAHVTANDIVFEFRGGTDVVRGLLLIMALGTMLASIVVRNHLLAALMLGVAGYSVGGLFLLEPAPDVALVQFMVETLGTVLLIVMLARISAEQRQEAMDSLWKQTRGGLLRDGLIAVVIGVSVGLFALAAVTSRPKPESIATWHLENALPLVGIPDVVGAIVTDFRGMDTLIEITVFSAAALGVLSLLSAPETPKRWPTRALTRLRTPPWRTFRRGAQHDSAEPLHLTSSEDDSPDQELYHSIFSTPLTRVAAQVILPFAFLVALAQLLYGGEGPGDGFTAGVISGLGVALWYIVFGYHDARYRLRRLHERQLIGLGLALVIAGALLPLLLGKPFLAHVSFDMLPLPADLHLSSTLIYEAGIFLTVLGSVSTILEAIANPREVEPL